MKVKIRRETVRELFKTCLLQLIYIYTKSQQKRREYFKDANNIKQIMTMSKRLGKSLKHINHNCVPNSFQFHNNIATLLSFKKKCTQYISNKDFIMKTENKVCI